MDVNYNAFDLFELPPELFLCVLDHVDEATKIALALTCKRFYRRFPKPMKPLPEETLRALLPLLEKELPDSYVCFGCNKLHHWTLDGGKTVRHDQLTSCEQPARLREWIDRQPWHESQLWRPLKGHESPTITEKSNDQHYQAAPENGRITYALLRIVMNRHLYGEAHGPDLHALDWEHNESYNHNDTQSPGTFRRRTHRRAKIIDNELLIATQTIMWHESKHTLDTEVDVMSFLGTGNVMGSFCCPLYRNWLNLLHLWSVRERPDEKHDAMKGVVTGCRGCRRDWRITEMEKEDGADDGTCKFLLEMWHRVGDLRQHDEISRNCFPSWTGPTGLVYEDWNREED